MSPIKFLAKTVLPAPIKVIFGIQLAPSICFLSKQSLHLEMAEGGQMLPVLLKHTVDHLPNLCQRKHCGSEGIVGNGLINQARVTADRSLYSHLLNRRAKI